jgi:hypothetical protein
MWRPRLRGPDQVCRALDLQEADGQRLLLAVLVRVSTLRLSDKSRNPHSSSPKDWPCPQSAIALSLEFGNRKDRRSIPGSPASRRNRRGPHWKDDSLVGNWRTSESGLVDSALIRSYGNERMASKSQCTAYCGEMLVFKDFHREGQ